MIIIQLYMYSKHVNNNLLSFILKNSVSTPSPLPPPLKMPGAKLNYICHNMQITNFDKKELQLIWTMYTSFTVGMA